MKLSLLRGRVAVRPIVETKIGSILMPDTHGDWTNKNQRALGIKAGSSHQAKVLGMGPPAVVYNKHELSPGFDVGDTIVFVWAHSEKWSDGQIWEDGEPCVFISQEEVQAVYE